MSILNTTPDPNDAPTTASDCSRPLRAKTEAPSSTILRFTKSEIRLHWAIAAPFVLCYASALILFVFYYNVPQRPFQSTFSWIHRLSGICLIVLPPLVVMTSRRNWNLFCEDFKQGWIWALHDVKWLLLSGLAAVSSKVSLPEQGKFNAGEKLNFMMVTTTYPVLVVTGVMIWLPGVSYYAWLIHFLMALVATPFMVGHIFMSTINPSTRKGLPGMIVGRVDREWAKHHYALWYREVFGGEESSENREEAMQSALITTSESGANTRSSESGERLDANPHEIKTL